MRGRHRGALCTLLPASTTCTPLLPHLPACAARARTPVSCLPLQVFGENMAILSGDALLVYAFEHIARDTKGVSADRIVKVVVELARASGADGLVGGQVVDIQSEDKEVRRDREQQPLGKEGSRGWAGVQTVGVGGELGRGWFGGAGGVRHMIGRGFI